MTITLLGFPWDASSSYARGPALAPPVIRAVLFAESSSPYSIDGLDARETISVYDFADLPSDGAEARAAISARISAATKAKTKPLSLGGDHSVTYPILKALKDFHGPMNILHVDAHTDLYDEFEGDPYSHACPFARAIEDGCVGTLVQVGLRSIGPAQRVFGEKHGVVMLGADEADAIPYDRLTGPLYVSIDLDGLDPAFAPGVSHPEPGGLSTRDVISMIKRLKTAPIGADIVELNPEKDINLLTAHVAARLVKELAGAMAG
ncbi:agmatinase [Hyphococcus sp.]|uniref:agmatinase n=1 Tax=Hyphococcus sp. TaxID=2038636 RepID=UPI00208BE1F6|nr:MAG: arginase [Marinicaulis sp.]